MEEKAQQVSLWSQAADTAKRYFQVMAEESDSLIRVFGIVLSINFPLFYVIWRLTATGSNEYESLTLRLSASLVCIPLIFNHLWPKRWQHYLTLYWFFAACYCLPFFFIFMLLKNNASTLWLMNCISASFFVMLVFDAITSIMILIIGLTGGVLAFAIVSPSAFVYIPGSVNMPDIIATFFAVIVIGMIFSRSRQEVDIIRRRLTNDELESVLARYKKFVLNQEHDIRTPYSGVVSLSEHLLGEIKDPEHKEIVQYIYESGKEQLDYQNSLIDSIYLFTDETEAYSRRFEPRLLVEQVLKIYGCALVDHDIQSHMTVADVVPDFLVGDSFRLKQILVRLVDNAIKFIEGAGNITLAVTGEMRGSTHFILDVSVADSGIGFDEADSAVIFEPFHRLTLSNMGKYKGRGIGLAFVKKLIEEISLDELHAEINVKSSPGEGSAFRVLVPFKVSLSQNPT